MRWGVRNKIKNFKNFLTPLIAHTYVNFNQQAGQFFRIFCAGCGNYSRASFTSPPTLRPVSSAFSSEQEYISQLVRIAYIEFKTEENSSLIINQ